MPKNGQPGFHSFCLMVGTRNEHFLPFPLRSQSMAVQFELRTKVDDRARCGMKSVPATSLPLRPLLLLGLVALVVKNPPANAGDARDVGLIPGSEKSPGVGNGNLLQYSCPKNSMDKGACWATVHRIPESDTTEQLSMNT